MADKLINNQGVITAKGLQALDGEFKIREKTGIKSLLSACKAPSWPEYWEEAMPRYRIGIGGTTTDSRWWRWCGVKKKACVPGIADDPHGL